MWWGRARRPGRRRCLPCWERSGVFALWIAARVGDHAGHITDRLRQKQKVGEGLLLKFWKENVWVSTIQKRWPEWSNSGVWQKPDRGLSRAPSVLLKDCKWRGRNLDFPRWPCVGQRRYSVNKLQDGQAQGTQPAGQGSGVRGPTLSARAEIENPASGEGGWASGGAHPRGAAGPSAAEVLRAQARP